MSVLPRTAGIDEASIDVSLFVGHGDAVARQSHAQNEDTMTTAPSFTSMSTKPPM